jgi:Ion channel
MNLVPDQRHIKELCDRWVGEEDRISEIVSRIEKNKEWRDLIDGTDKKWNKLKLIETCPEAYGGRDLRGIRLETESFCFEKSDVIAFCCFDYCKLDKITFENVLLHGTSFANSTIGENCWINGGMSEYVDLSYCNFNGGLSSVIFIRPNIVGTNFVNANFENVRFSEMTYREEIIEGLPFRNIGEEKINTLQRLIEVFQYYCLSVLSNVSRNAAYSLEFGMEKRSFSKEPFYGMFIVIYDCFRLLAIKCTTNVPESGERLQVPNRWTRFGGGSLAVDLNNIKTEVSLLEYIKSENSRYFLEKYHKTAAFFHYVTSLYGRSTLRVIFWLFFIWISFGYVYTGFLENDSLSKTEFCPYTICEETIANESTSESVGISGKLTECRSWLVPYYFSMVTMTTLGFGDITPSLDNTALLFLICIQVLSGYIILALLISTFIGKK